MINVFFYFFLYSFLGWTMEVLAVLFTKKILVNRGFLIGPLCPIYGVSAFIMLLFLKDTLQYPIFTFLAIVILCCTLEYVTSYVMEKLFQARWWDYSNRFCNINGRICLSNALAFGTLGLLLLYVIHPFFQKIIMKVPYHILYGLTIVFLLTFLVDLCVSFKIVLKLKQSMKFIRTDNTKEITEKVKATLKTSFLGKRLLSAFPTLHIIIKDLGQNLERQINKISNRGVK